MQTAFRIRRLDAQAARDAIPALSDVLMDVVDGGASVSFMADISRTEAEAFWAGVAESADGRVLLVAEDDEGVFGTVQVVPAWPPNQPHRADVAKLLVSRRGRKRGVGNALMHEAEKAALDMGRTVLVLDTVTGEAGERLYARRGWTRVGEIPDFALMPDGRPCPTTIFYKVLR
jgi:GNAT superfamily N-acetyltransferase